MGIDYIGSRDKGGLPGDKKEYEDMSRTYPRVYRILKIITIAPSRIRWIQSASNFIARFSSATSLSCILIYFTAVSPAPYSQ